MTREQKLALIVGFSLILVVGVLISDHFSRARQARIAPVAAVDSSPPDVRLRPVDPLRVDGLAEVPPAPETIALRSAGGGLSSAQSAAHAETPPGQAGTLPQVSAGERGSGTASAASDSVSTGGPIVSQTGAGADRVERLSTVQADGTSGVPAPGPVVPLARPGVAPPPAAAAAPGAGSGVRTHTVRKGDTLIRIARSVYGDERMWREVARINGIEGETIRVGQVLRLPPIESLGGSIADAPTGHRTGSPGGSPGGVKPAATPPPRPAASRPATYTVRRGDTLGEIARRTLGSARRWRELAEFNDLEDEDFIPVGMVLRLPQGG